MSRAKEEFCWKEINIVETYYITVMVKIKQVGIGQMASGTIDGITYVTRGNVTFARSTPTMPAHVFIGLSIASKFSLSLLDVGVIVVGHFLQDSLQFFLVIDDLHPRVDDGGLAAVRTGMLVVGA